MNLPIATYLGGKDQRSDRQEENCVRLLHAVRRKGAYRANEFPGSSLKNAMESAGESVVPVLDSMGIPLESMAVFLASLRARVDPRTEEQAGRWLHARAVAAYEYLREKHFYESIGLREQIDPEISTMVELGAATYVKQVVELCDYARKNQIPIGMGRGSAPASTVLYLCGVTAVNPVRMHLTFERWLSKDRRSIPDIDIDVDNTRLDDLRNALPDLFPENGVAHLSVIKSFKAHDALRAVHDALSRQKEKGVREREWSVLRDTFLAKDQSGNYGLTPLRMLPRQVFDGETGSYHRRIYQATSRIIGRYENTSVHASGLIGVPSDIRHYTSIYYDTTRQIPVAHADTTYFEILGHPKFDLLSSRHLGLIRLCQEKVLQDERLDDAVKEPMRDWLRDPVIKESSGPDDPEVLIPRVVKTDINDYEIIRHLISYSRIRFLKDIYHIGTQGGLSIYDRLMSAHQTYTTVEDLALVLAINRPGVDPQIIELLEADKNMTWPKAIRDDVEIGITKKTHGVIVYQEQVFQLLNDIAGLKKNEAWEVIYAIKSKDVEKMKALKERFVVEIKERYDALTTREIESVWHVVERFAGYGFNMPHAISYAQEAWQEMYLKAHHEEHYRAAKEEVGRRTTQGALNFTWDTEQQQSLRSSPSPLKDPTERRQAERTANRG